MQNSDSTAYKFGDSELAGDRLRLLAAAFEPSSRKFLESLRHRNPSTIADLGCGPGYTTRLLAEVFPSAKVFGFDNSPNFISQARTTGDGRIEFQLADVTRRFSDERFNLIYARYLLTHVSQFLETVQLWGECLTPAGLIAIEENEWIKTEQAEFQQYLSIVNSMLAAGGQQLYVGVQLDAVSHWRPLARVSSELVPIHLDAKSAARLFLPNLLNWRHQVFIRQNYSETTLDQLERNLRDIAEGKK